MFTPEYISNTKEFIEQKKEFLRRFVGLKLKESWVVWDLEDNELFKDGPVILVFGKKKLVFCTNKLEELSVTDEEINVTEKPVVSWAEYDLEWRLNPLQEINNYIGNILKNIYVTESEFSGVITESKSNPGMVGAEISDWYLSGLDFEFYEGYLSLFNALDENGVSNCAEIEKATRRIEI